MKTLTRTDKQIIMNELAGQAEDVAGRGEQDRVIFGANKPPPKEADMQEAARDLDVNTNPLGKDQSSHQLSRERKIPWTEQSRAEVFKADPQLAADLLQPLLRDIWEEKKLHEDRTEGVIVKIQKKGALKNCNKSRGITLLSVPSKILAKIIVQPIAETVDQHLRGEHVGFWKGKGCTDQIFILRNIIEQCTECQRQLYINL